MNSSFGLTVIKHSSLSWYMAFAEIKCLDIPYKEAFHI